MRQLSYFRTGHLLSYFLQRPSLSIDLNDCFLFKVGNLKTTVAMMVNGTSAITAFQSSLPYDNE
jgi:hypothetical protein